jgi:glycosyltransferase involved in cell wall biosynthesis
MFEPIISVVIPCFNVQDTLREAIESVQAQSAPVLETICINDGSNDSTLALLSEMALDGIVKCIHLETSGGASRARNIGSLSAKGKIIQFLDADDTLADGKLLRQITILNESGADFIAGGYEYQNLAGNISTHQPDKDAWAGLIESKLGRTSSNIFRAEALQAVGGWSERQRSSQEYELMFRLLRNGARIAMDDLIGARIRAKIDGISNTNIRDNAIRFIELRGDIMNYLERNQLITSHRKTCFARICEIMNQEISTS